MLYIVLYIFLKKNLEMTINSEQIKLLTSPSTAINVGASVATGTDISENLSVSLDIDQMVFCSTALDPDIDSKINLSYFILLLFLVMLLRS